MNAVIIEDERHAQLELTRLLAKVDPAIRIETCLASIEESVRWLSLHTPDLLFMDIRLADGLSFDILLRTAVRSPVIFTTAYDQFALEAFKTNGIDYLLKPVEEMALKSAIEKFHRLTGGRAAKQPAYPAEVVERLVNSLKPPAYKSRLLLVTGERVSYIPITEVAYLTATGNTVFCITRGNARVIVDGSLNELEGLLNPVDFRRLNRSVIAHIGAIAEIRKHFNGRLKVVLKPAYAEEIFVSREKAAEFLSWLNS